MAINPQTAPHPSVLSFAPSHFCSNFISFFYLSRGEKKKKASTRGVCTARPDISVEAMRSARHGACACPMPFAQPTLVALNLPPPLVPVQGRHLHGKTLCDQIVHPVWPLTSTRATRSALLPLECHPACMGRSPAPTGHLV